MSLFAPDQHNGRSNELLPIGLLTWARLEFDKLRHSTKADGGRYASMKATVVLGKHQNRVLFFTIADIFDARNSDKYKEMAFVQLKHICEAWGIFQPQSPASYAQFDGCTFEQILQRLTSHTDPVAPIRVTLEKGKDGYEDKNSLEFLSPNPNSTSKKNYDKLVAVGAVGEVVPEAKAGAVQHIPAQPGLFGGNPQQNVATAQQAAPDWVGQPNQVAPQPAPAQQVQQQPQNPATAPVHSTPVAAAPVAGVPAAIQQAVQQQAGARPF